MATNGATIEVFVNEDGGIDLVALILRNTSIVEYEDELTPGLTMTPWNARCLAHALTECADRIDGTQSS